MITEEKNYSSLDLFEEHFLEQYFTSFQFSRHFFLQLNLRLHTKQILNGNGFFIIKKTLRPIDF